MSKILVIDNSIPDTQRFQSLLAKEDLIAEAYLTGDEASKALDKLGAEFGKPVRTGEFGADMQVELVNDGPVTIPMRVA
jgi:hypothetical protein